MVSNARKKGEVIANTSKSSQFSSRHVKTELKVAKQKLKDESSRRKKEEEISNLLHRWSDDILPNWDTM